MAINNITLLGLSLIFFYSISQILKFYGVGEEVYGYYLIFYVIINTYFTKWLSQSLILL